MMYYSNFLSPLGNISIICDDESLIALWFDGQKLAPLHLLESSVQDDDAYPICSVKAWLQGYFNGEPSSVDSLKLKPDGSEFQKNVWKQLLAIPNGETRTYSEIANEINKSGAKKTSARAVGSAVARNKIAIIIPCHRIIGASGSMTGFAAGIDKKVWLLQHEQNPQSN